MATQPPQVDKHVVRLDQPPQLARSLLREAWKGTLSTLDRAGGYPYGSLVAVACEPDGSPVFLLSGLAEHTKNLDTDQRVSLLIDATSPGPGALTGARVTLVGTIHLATSQTTRRRYLARHPDAAQFIDFADFKLYVLAVEWGHLVAGFGRIQRLTRVDLILDTAGAEALIEAESDILQHMNEDHSDTLAPMAAYLGTSRSSTPAENNGGRPHGWKMLGCDPEGIDLGDGAIASRIVFSQRVNSADEIRQALICLVTEARLSGGVDEQKHSD